MKRILAMLGCAMAFQPATAQQKGAADIISEHKLPIARSAPESYSGAGWDKLLADGRSAQFFMIGEQHGMADIALFETAVHRELATSGGYSHAAFEIGPYSTDFAEQLIRKSPGRVRSYIAEPGHAFALPFLFFGEEIGMAEQAVTMSPDKEHALWGLDQEFIGAGPIVVEILRGRTRTNDQKAAVKGFESKSNAEPFFVSKLNDVELGPLRAAFAGQADMLALINALQLSSDIYAPFTGGGGTTYAANLARENYMKVNFARQFADAERRTGKPPKVFMKFGGYHAMRGHSGTDVPSLANFVAEWGVPRGFGLVNIMVDCNGGEALNPQTNQPEPCEPYFGSDSLLGKLATDDVTMIDLKALRPRLGDLKDIDPKTRQTILAFDYYLTIRGGHAATPVGQVPAK